MSIGKHRGTYFLEVERREENAHCLPKVSGDFALGTDLIEDLKKQIQEAEIESLSITDPLDLIHYRQEVLEHAVTDLRTIIQTVRPSY